MSGRNFSRLESINHHSRVDREVTLAPGQGRISRLQYLKDTHFPGLRYEVVILVNTEAAYIV